MKNTSGPGKRGRGEEQKVDLAEIRLMIFQADLAHRLVERIMQEGLMSSVYDWYPDLERVLSRLYLMDSLLRRMIRNGTEAERGGGTESREPPPEVDLG